MSGQGYWLWGVGDGVGDDLSVVGEGRGVLSAVVRVSSIPRLVWGL